jgi:hypothetical protein
MGVVERLASSLGRNDEQPNIAVAEEIVAGNDTGGVRELVNALGEKNKALKSDALKALYEIGGRSPALIAPHIAHFKNLLASGDNRMVWGAMCAIDAIAGVKPEAVYMMLPQIMQAVDKGTVITRDHAVKAMVKLAAEDRFAKTTTPLLIEQLRICPVNQLPMYAELVSTIARGPATREMELVLTARMAAVEQPAKRKRIEKVLKKLSGT